MKITVEEIKAELESLSLYYNTRRSDNDLLATAVMWAEDAGHLSQDEFIAAIKLARKRCRFFLVMADVLDAHKELMDHKPPVAALPNNGTPISLDEMRRIRDEKFPRMVSGIGRRI